MADAQRYVVTARSCSCETDSGYVYLTEEEKALLARVDQALGGWGLIVAETPEEAGEYAVRNAEWNARRAAIGGGQEVER